MTAIKEFANRIVGHGAKPADQFQAHPLNYRKHPQRQRDAVQASLRELGWIGVVIENVQTGNLIDGHERVWQALQNGGDVPYIQVDLSPEEEALALATFDPITNMAETDAAKLDELLRDVSTGEAALMDLIGEMATEAGLYAPPPVEDAEPQTDRAEELRQEWGVELGQLWRLPSRTPGQEHRLICGDCTDAAVVERVMGGELADCVVTDPPYAVFGSSTGIGKNLQDDNMILPFCRAVYEVACAHTPISAHVYIHCDWKSFNAWWSQVGRYDLRVLNCIVWDKGDGGIGTNYTNKHEFVMFMNREPAQQSMTEKGKGMRLVHGIANVQRFNITSGDDRQHNAAKPVGLIQVFIGASTDDGDVVLEPFSGSGTTIIAAENLARQCRAVEISPGYVAVALQRYVDTFGITPELVE